MFSPNAGDEKKGDSQNRMNSCYLFFQKFSEYLRLKYTQRRLLNVVWTEIISKKKLKKYLRRRVYKKYHLSYKIMKKRIKLTTKFYKYANTKISAMNKA